jgi:hypothetical protein
MAAPKKAGGGGGVTGKKAKLAHEKRSAEDTGPKGQFLLKAIYEFVTDKSGKPGVVVDLDEKGTKGVVDRVFVKKGEDGLMYARQVACPALYDAVAQQQAIARYASLAQV